MPTTAYVEFTAAVRGIQSRTDSAGAAVTDLTGEEDRLVHALMTEGALSDNAFLVRPDSPVSMSVLVGSGVAKADLFAVAGEIAGQGTYIARLDATEIEITASAADPSQARTDEIWLVVMDDPYDTSGRGLPRLAYRRGDAGGGNPGADTAWKASALLARLTVGAAATTIPAANISDERTYSMIRPPAGTINAWGTNDVPAGALRCDGTAVSRTTYRRLFAAIGTQHGAGDGSTTFNLPNGKGRMLVGWDAAQTEFNAVGNVGGAKTDTATTGASNANNSFDVTGGINTGATTEHGHEVTVDTLPPFLVVNWIIWT